PAPAGSVTILEMEGLVQVLRAGKTLWADAQTNDVLIAGERFRTHTNSRALLRLSDRSQIRVGELSEFQVAPASQPGASPFHKLWRGVIYFFHRDKPGDYRFDTPTASAAVRGTEFVLNVDDAGRTVVTVLDGIVTLSNAVAHADVRTG